MADSYTLARELKLPYYNGDFQFKKAYDLGKKWARQEDFDRAERKALDDERNKERKKKSELEEFAGFTGVDKRKAYITKEIFEAKKAAEDIRNLGNMIVGATHIQRESDTAILSGMATAIGGIGAGVHVALDAERKNAEIREKNAANLRETIGLQNKMNGAANEYEEKIIELQSELKQVDELYISEIDTNNLMKNIEIKTISATKSKTPKPMP